MMFDSILQLLFQGKALSKEAIRQLFSAIIRGKLTDVQLAGVMIALKLRGVTSEELTGAAQALLHHAAPFPRPDYDFADIVGTGGDGTNSINISTASAFVCAAMGLPIAKHGSRSVSSQSGSSDVLTALGIDLTLSAEQSRQYLDQHQLCFLFAPHYHAGFRHAAPARQQLKTRTIFNVLGPLINPARPQKVLLGVYDPALLQPMAETLQQLGYHHALVVYGAGLDEVAIHDVTQVAELKENQIKFYTVTPEDFHLPRYDLQSLKGGSPQQNCDALTALLKGEGHPAHEAAVAANVAMVMRLFGHQDLAKNSKQALNAIHRGQAYRLVTQLRQGNHHVTTPNCLNANCAG